MLNGFTNVEKLDIAIGEGNCILNILTMQNERIVFIYASRYGSLALIYRLYLSIFTLDSL